MEYEPSDCSSSHSVSSMMQDFAPVEGVLDSEIAAATVRKVNKFIFRSIRVRKV